VELEQLVKEMLAEIMLVQVHMVEVVVEVQVLLALLGKIPVPVLAVLVQSLH
jgi:hypothetical protein